MEIYIYKQHVFKSKLDVTWAIFFDLARWDWTYLPQPVEGWQPEFYVEFFCGHSECEPYHKLLITVRDFNSIDQFADDPCMDHGYNIEEKIYADSGAAFGSSPEVTYWEIVHGPGGGEEDVPMRESNYKSLWTTAMRDASLLKSYEFKGNIALGRIRE